jgi:hypothetical protein
MNEQNNMLMEFKTIGSAKRLTKLSYLGQVNSSAKIAKNLKTSNNLTYVLYLLPAKASGYNVCAMATTECIDGCLNTSGRVKMQELDVSTNTILNARYRKTRLFFEQRNFFMNWLIAEIANNKKKAEKKGIDFSVRLNGTSDINWNAYKVNGKTVFELFPTVQFYDYTKIASKFNDIPENYHLTYSYTGYNWDYSKKVLDSKNNVAIVFNVEKNKPLPMTYKGYKVIDGDLTDYRPDDGNGVIVGLRWKKIADKVLDSKISNSIFVIQSNDVNCSYATVPENKSIKKVA